MCWGSPWSCSLGTGLPHQRRAPLAAQFGRPGGDVMEKREELSMYFYVALCICPDCFALNSVAGNLTGMWGVSSGISPVTQGRGWQKNIVYDKSSAVENSFGSWAKGRLLRSTVKKSAQAATQNVLLLWLRELEVCGSGKSGLSDLLVRKFLFLKYYFGEKEMVWSRERVALVQLMSSIVSRLYKKHVVNMWSHTFIKHFKGNKPLFMRFGLVPADVWGCQRSNVCFIFVCSDGKMVALHRVILEGKGRRHRDGNEPLREGKQPGCCFWWQWCHLKCFEAWAGFHWSSQWFTPFSAEKAVKQEWITFCTIWK